MADHVLHPTARRKSPVEDVLHAAENLLSVRITLHDLAGVFVDASGKSLLDPWRGSHRRYETCALDYCKRCLRHCFQVVNRRAAKAGGAFTHRCWKGFVELVVPLRREDVHVATLFAGQWRPRRMRLSPDIGAQTVERIRRLAPTEGKRLVQLGAVLETVGAGLLARADELRGVNRPALSRAEAIRRFLELHAPRVIGLADLARVLHLSPSRASHLVRELTGSTFQDLLVAERLRKAQALLRSTDLTVAEVGRLVGIDNECYFSRLFRARLGVPPSAYRRRGTPGKPRPDLPARPAGNAG